MKFRAVIQDAEYMREFEQIILTLSKLSKECVISITADKVHFIANEESGTVAPLVWIEIDSKLYFSEYTMEGVNATHPQIVLTVSPSNLGRALSMLRSNARCCKIKLTNIQFPCLSIAVDVLSQMSAQARQVVHDVPVSVIPRCDWHAYAVPKTPTCKLTLNLPSIRLLRGLIDKLRNLSPKLTFNVTSNGEMNLVAETEMATIATRFKNLEIHSQNPSDEDKTKEHFGASCPVDCKKAGLLFTSLQVPTLEMSCGVDSDYLVHLLVNVRQGVVIHSILPALCV